VRTADLAAAELERYRELRDQGFISGLELERRESTLKAQKAQLAPGQTFVTSGVHTLTPGQRVRLYEAPPAVAGKR